MEKSYCTECGAPLQDTKECRDYLNEMIRWDFQDFLNAGQVHHLTVLCYNLQHPNVYSSRGLQDAKEFLKEFVIKHATFEEHDQRNRKRLSSSVRDWKITGTPQDHGTYKNKLSWTTHAKDIVDQGLDHYIENINMWAESIYSTLEQSGNLK